MALRDHLFGEILGPVVFVLLHLPEGGPKIGVVPFPFAVFQKPEKIGNSLVRFLLVTQVAAQQVVFEEEAVFHHLKPHILNDFYIA